MGQSSTQMDVLHNQTYTDTSYFQHNETHFIQNSSHINSTDCSIRGTWNYVEMAVSWVVFFTAFPGICFALCKFRSQVRPDQVAPVYVINLLISDLIQVCTNPVKTTLLYYCLLKDVLYSNHIYLFGVQVNIFFMMCISAERYVMIAHAVWYRNIQNRKVSIIVSVIIWILSVVTQLTYSFLVDETISGYVTCTIFLVPHPVVMFLFVATWRALSRTSVPRHDQIRIRAILGLIRCIFTILCMPFIMLKIITSNPLLFIEYSIDVCIQCIAYTLVVLNPLFDLLLYVLIRRDVSHVWRALLFCCNKKQGANITNV